MGAGVEGSGIRRPHSPWAPPAHTGIWGWGGVPVRASLTLPPSFRSCAFTEQGRQQEVLMFIQTPAIQ